MSNLEKYVGAFEEIFEVDAETAKELKYQDINAWDERWELGNISTSTGQPAESTLFIRSSYFCGCVPGITYYGKSSGTYQLVIYWYDVQKNYISFA